MEKIRSVQLVCDKGIEIEISLDHQIIEPGAKLLDVKESKGFLLMDLGNIPGRKIFISIAKEYNPAINLNRSDLIFNENKRQTVILSKSTKESQLLFEKEYSLLLKKIISRSGTSRGNIFKVGVRQTVNKSLNKLRIL